MKYKSRKKGNYSETDSSDYSSDSDKKKVRIFLIQIFIYQVMKNLLQMKKEMRKNLT